jgi:hypothetical protein
MPKQILTDEQAKAELARQLAEYRKLQAAAPEKLKQVLKAGGGVFSSLRIMSNVSGGVDAVAFPLTDLDELLRLFKGAVCECGAFSTIGSGGCPDCPAGRMKKRAPKWKRKS